MNLFHNPILQRAAIFDLSLILAVLIMRLAEKWDERR
jgi:hypothetical protein